MQTEQGSEFWAVSFGRARAAPSFVNHGSVNLPPKALAVLGELVSRAGQVVTKEELLATVWARHRGGRGDAHRLYWHPALGVEGCFRPAPLHRHRAPPRVSLHQKSSQ